MNKKAIEIMAGSTVLVEYGVPDNYVPFKVRAVYATESKVVLTAESKVGNETFVLRPEEELLLLPEA